MIDVRGEPFDFDDKNPDQVVEENSADRARLRGESIRAALSALVVFAGMAALLVALWLRGSGK